jgi:G:T-mismatch repair DNA endonuclease (very short patch repair protein)
MASAFLFFACFWHGRPLYAIRPKTNAAFWRKRIAARRDCLVTRLIRADFLDPLFAFQIKLR